MEQDILRKLEEQGKRINEIYQSVEKMRQYFFWTLVITLVVIILPLVGLFFAIPAFLSTYGGSAMGF